MNSIIKIYDGSHPDDHSVIVEKTSKYIKIAAADIKNDVGEQLDDLLNLPYVPSPKTLHLLIQPWIRARAVTALLRSIDLSAEKNKFISTIKEIEKLEKSLRRIDKGLLMLLLETSSELMLELILKNLSELKDFLRKFSSLSFEYGQIHNPANLEIYALDSLLWMGKTMGLNKTGKPTQLNKYLHIVTDKLYQEINKYRSNYACSEEEYLAKYTLPIPLSALCLSALRHFQWQKYWIGSC